MLAVVFLAASIFDCIRWMRNYKMDAIVELNTLVQCDLPAIVSQ